jgi:hypothetical protein
VGLFVLLLTALACSPGELFLRPTPTPEPTRPPAATFTPTPELLQALVVVTPPSAGTPGVIIVPPGVDPSTLIPVLTATFIPEPTAAPTETPTSTPVMPIIETSPDVTPIAPDDVASPVPDDDIEDITEPLLPTPTVDRSRVVVFVPGPTPPASEAPPTETPTPLPTFTPTVTPTPFVVVEAGLVSLRSGPGVEYPLVAQLGPNIPIAITGRNPEGTWLQICCVNAESLWVAATHVRAENNIDFVPLVLPDVPPPPPTATPTPTDTPTITPTPTATPHPFQIAEGPQFFPTNNPMLVVWVKVFTGPITDPQPLPGYFLNVEFRWRDEAASWDSRPNTRGEAPSQDFFDFSAPPGPAGGNRVQFNYKYEFLPPDPRVENPFTSDTRLTLIDGYWRIYLTDGAGTQLSDYVMFDTLGGNPNREVFVAWTPR